MTETGLIKFFDLGQSEDGPSYYHIHGVTMDKLASECYTPKSLMDVMLGLKPRPEGRYVLINALGAFETWSSNRNGDGFPAWSLMSLPMPESVAKVIKPLIEKKIPGYVPPSREDYGYLSFPRHAHVFRNHDNKNPLTACGDVIASAYNERMHRVELIVFVYKDRAPDVVQKIDAGEPVAWSMGAKLRFDVCSICLNIALTRSEYCTHLATQLGQVLPDGRKVFSYNYYPRFFDISEVRMPADRSAWLLKKVASVHTEEPVVKTAAIEKRYETTKSESLGTTPIDPKILTFLNDMVQKDMDEAPGLDPQMMRTLSNQFGVVELLKALTASGILLRPSEVDNISGSPDKIPENLDIDRPNRTLMILLKKASPKRSLLEEHFTKRAMRRQWETTATKPQEKRSEAHSKYAKMLRQIDLHKLSSIVDSDAVILTGSTSDLLHTLYKQGSKEAPRWLPFVVGIALSSDQNPEKSK